MLKRPSIHAEYLDFNEIVPGVFLSDDSVHIVDEVGEVCMWNITEMEDESAFKAVVVATALCAKHGPKAVRLNIEQHGKLAEQLIEETFQEYGE